ncbi:hypothetical protein [Actinomadura harenae]|uniref:hypothetical protein n=1 Tax=Actinomadura harenae TaxID=2483351 RepID=UPI0011C405AE|nr:hypothetical protein [Actinomadura harenae]
MDRQSSGDGVGRQEPSEVMGGAAEWLSGGVDDSDDCDSLVQKPGVGLAAVKTGTPETSLHSHLAAPAK